MIERRRKLRGWERDLLWRLSEGRCGICNQALDLSDWHADHIDAFRETGRTNVHEMQALCASCNLKKGSKDMSLAVHELRKFSPNFEGYREDQARLHMRTLDEVRRGSREIGIHLHIRGGKSMLIRMLSVHLAELYLAAVSLAVNNRGELRRQIVNTQAWPDDFRRLNTMPPRPAPHGLAHVKRKNNGEELTGWWPDEPWPNNEYLLSTSIQLLCSKTQQAIEWIKSVNHKTGLPLAIFLDEAQEFGIDDTGTDDAESRDWADVLQRIQRETNVILITLSGYPFRQDGKLMPGFRGINETEKAFKKVTRGALLREEGDLKVYDGQLIEGTALTFNLVPIHGEDFVAGMRRGFDTGALCSVLHQPVAHKITYKINGEIILDNQSLADVEPFVAQQVIGSYLEQIDVIDAMMMCFLSELEGRRCANPRVKGAAFGMADIGGRTDDQHLLLIQERLRAIAPHLKSRLITNRTEGSTSDLLLSFNDDEYDVLLLKNIGRVGFDCPRLKVLADLSTVRGEGKVAQTWLRVSTPFDNIPGVIITPGDRIATELFKKIVTNNGGNEMKRTKDTQIVEHMEIYVEKKDRLLEIGEQIFLPIVQNDMNVVMPDEHNLVRTYLQEYPAYNGYLQRMEPFLQVQFVRDQIKNFSWMPKDFQSPTSAPPREPHHYRNEINDLIDKATHRAAGTSGPYKFLPDDDKKKWREARAAIWRRAKQRAGQPEDRQLEQIQNLEALESIRDFINEYAR